MRMRFRQGLRLACGVTTILVGLTSLVACEALADHERTGGSSSEGYFETTRRNVVVGAELDLEIEDWEYVLWDEPTEVEDVNVEPAERASLLGVSEGTVTLRGESVGPVTVAFRGLTDGEWQDDSFAIDAVEPKVFEMERCQGFYVRGERGFVRYTWNPGERYANDEKAYGTGFYPVSVTPWDGLVVRAHGRSVEDFAVDISETAPDVIELDSTLPNDTSETALVVVDRSEVSLKPSFIGDLRPDSETTLMLTAHVTVDGQEQPVCSELEVTVRSLTTAACVPVDPKTGKTATSVTLHDTTLTIQAREVGECRIEVSIPGVEGSVAAASASVERPSSSGSSGGGDIGDWD